MPPATTRRPSEKKIFGDEFFYESAPVFFESEKPKGILAFIEGTAAECDIVNTNNRLYTRTAFMEGVKDLKAKGWLEKGKLTGQIEHPGTKDGTHSLRDVAIKYTDLYVTEKDDSGRSFLKYKGAIIDNAEGRHLMSLLDAGVDVGISTRSRVQVTPKKMTVRGESVEVNEVKRMMFLGMDPVSNPSNKSGGITHYESEEEEDMKLTVESLREDHADLVTAIESEAIKGLFTEEQVNAKVAEALKGMKKAEEVEAEIKTATESAVAEAVKPLFTEAQVTEKIETAKKEAVTGLFTEAQVTEKVNAAVEAVRKEKTKEQIAAERVTKIDGICKDPKHAKYAKVLRPLLDAVAVESELTNVMVESKAKEAEAIAVSAGLMSKGKGKVKPSGTQNNTAAEESEKGEEEKASSSRHSRLAGIE